MEKLKKQIGEHYDRNQIFYDLFWMNKKNLGMHYGFWGKNTKNLHEAILNENKEIAKKLDIKKSDIILDAGCGVGGTTIWLAENYGVKVIGISISEKQVKLAKKYAEERRVSHLVKFEARDFCHTGFPEESFTKIISIESACHAEKKEEFMKEAFKLLRPEGKIAVADFFIKENLNEEEEKLVAEFCYGWEIPNLPTLADFQEKLKEAKFKNIEVIDKTKEIEPSSRKMFIVIGVLLRLVLKISELLKYHSGYGGTRSAKNQYYMFKRRIATYNIFLAQK